MSDSSPLNAIEAILPTGMTLQQLAALLAAEYARRMRRITMVRTIFRALPVMARSTKFMFTKLLPTSIRLAGRARRPAQVPQRR